MSQNHIQSSAESSTTSLEVIKWNMTKFLPGHLQSLQYNQSKTVYPTSRNSKTFRKKKGSKGNETWVGKNMFSTQQKYQMLLPCNSGHTPRWVLTYRPIREGEDPWWTSSNTVAVVIREWEGLWRVWALTHIVFLLDLFDNLCICWSSENPLCIKSCEMTADRQEKNQPCERL